VTAWLRRRDRVDAAFALATVVAAAVILRLGLGLTFFADEWALIETRSLGDPASWFRPHNEHWYTLPIVVYRLLVETVGLGSYVPYLLVVTLLHVTVAALVYVLVRRRTAAGVALGAALIVLFLGSGFENLFWGFQIGFVASMATGLGALAVLEGPVSGRRSAAGIGLLIGGLMSSGVGVIFVVVVGIDLLLDPRRRIVSPLLGIPVALYVTWYALIGRAGIGTFASVRDPQSVAAWIDAPGAIVAGTGNAVGAVVGVGPTIGVWVGIVGLTLAGVWILTNPRGPGTGRFLACLAGIATQYALIGVFRGDLVADVTNYTRYTYVSAILLIVGATALMPRFSITDPVLRRRIVLVGGGSLLVVSLSWNARLLVEGQAVFEARAEMTRALVAAGLQPRSSGSSPSTGRRSRTAWHRAQSLPCLRPLRPRPLSG
jgi:hypothetical protein